MSTDYKNLLNDKQYEACITTEGPLLILAGAGSGKTRTVTHRIAYLLEAKNVAPWSILAITFTNKAAAEMKSRVKTLVGDAADSMWISTFHSSCLRILRRDIDKLGFRKDFSIYDTYDQKSLIKQCMNELNIGDKEFSEKDFMKAISSAKDSLIDTDKYLELNLGNFRKRKVGEVYQLYQRKLSQNMALDFDDIIMLTVKLFKMYPETLDFYRKKFKYILVDEYQDTNKAQYELIYLLAGEHHNLCVVGDDDQSIYKFRGSDLRNILEFEKDYPDARVIKLEANYRSTANIISAANAVIKNNSARKAKTMTASRDTGDKIKIYRAFSDNDEGTFISKEITKLAADGRNWNEFAVLYRTNAQSRIFEDSFMRNGIPYRLLGGLKFYDRREIKDVLAYARILNNPFDEVSLRRIINVPKRAIGDATVDKISQQAFDTGVNMYDIIMDIEEYGILSGRALHSVVEFRNLINTLMTDSVDQSVQETLSEILDKTGYLREYVKSRNPEDLSRVENIEELINAAANYDLAEGGTLQGFLEDVALISDVDKYDDEADAVVMMTVHTAKGLEFPVVFMVGMENGLFPGTPSFEDPNEMEESRRLAYVGMTRAKDILYMTHAEARMVYGRTMMYPQSDFIMDIPDDFKMTINEGWPRTTISERSRKAMPYQTHGIRENVPPNQSEIKAMAKNDTMENFLTEGSATVGRKVNHPKFGNGIIVSTAKERDDMKVKVVFDNYGIKSLLLSLAPLKPLD